MEDFSIKNVTVHLYFSILIKKTKNEFLEILEKDDLFNIDIANGKWKKSNIL